MRRLLILAGLPLVLLALWAVSGNNSDANAEVRIETSNVTELRASVIARMTTLGAVRVGEETNYSDGTKSTLEFRVSAAKLERVLNELDDVGGRITDQTVNLDPDSGSSLSEQLDNLDSCLSGFADATTAGDISGAIESDVSDCQSELRQLNSTVASNDLAGADALIQVTIQHPSSKRWLLGVAIMVLFISMIAFLIWLLRSDPDQPYQDLEALEDVEEELLRKPHSNTREIYLRRN